MRSLATETVAWGFDHYDGRWNAVARAGLPHVAMDTRLAGWRYLSLSPVLLSPAEAAELRRLTRTFGRLLDRATEGLLHDAGWAEELAWPAAAVELARQEPSLPDGHASLLGRFDWLMERSGGWQLLEYNADTPSGGREVSAFEAPVARLHQRPGTILRRLSGPLPRLLGNAVLGAIRNHERATGRPVGLVGVISSHSWTEDTAQAWWLALLLRAAGVATLVGDVKDLAVRRGSATLRGRSIDALYRFYPVERFYAHGVFGPLVELALDRRLLFLNGLRAFLAQSKAALAWLWENRGSRVLGPHARSLIQAHLPATYLARVAVGQPDLLDGVVKHVNGREGDTVAFGEALDAAAWQDRLLEGGYVVQRRVDPVLVRDADVDEIGRVLRLSEPRVPVVGTFCVAGHFGGCYTRLGAPITTSRAAFVPTLVERSARAGPSSG